MVGIEIGHMVAETFSNCNQRHRIFLWCMSIAAQFATESIPCPLSCKSGRSMIHAADSVEASTVMSISKHRKSRLPAFALWLFKFPNITEFHKNSHPRSTAKHRCGRRIAPAPSSSGYRGNTPIRSTPIRSTPIKAASSINAGGLLYIPALSGLQPFDQESLPECFPWRN